ncbi:MAG: hypothetical protein EOR00_22215 [Mesorhizobium sp.]|uniref:hypothetical protein n=1 Tax=Mesorhizobium sp. TaxID=1871066 RepID=UPI000FE75022|nr:hypothetical protein [Mesorhizobium sp.]RWP14926.1 MAG: hypothetical protein EOR00_22215 [Mesorhizobium sp.]
MEIDEHNNNIMDAADCKDNEYHIKIAKSAFGIDGKEYYFDELVKSCQFQMEVIIERKNRSWYYARTEQAVRELNTLAKNVTLVTEELQATDVFHNDD